MSASQIERADMAEELAAGVALRLATSKDELISIWNRDCDHFEGEQRVRLQEIYREALIPFAPMQRAG